MRCWRVIAATVVSYDAHGAQASAQVMALQALG